MFNTNLLFLLIGISLPGILLLIPSLKKMYSKLKQEKKRDKFPSLTTFITISLIQSLVFVCIGSAVGIALSSTTGLHAPFLESLSQGKFSGDLLLPQLYSGIILGFSGSIILLTIYYTLVKRWLDTTTFEKMNDLRNSVGLGGRLLYGGVVEEILFRWGVMPIFFWMGLKLTEQHDFALWFSILLTGILFGIGHLPSYLAHGCKKSSPFVITVIGLNLFASIVFGWAFAQYGLCSAIIAHAMLHCIWYPVDRLFLKIKLNQVAI